MPTTGSISSTAFDRYFLTSSEESIRAYRDAIALAQTVLIEQFARQNQPYSGVPAAELIRQLNGVSLCSTQGSDLQTVLQGVGD